MPPILSDIAIILIKEMTTSAYLDSRKDNIKKRGWVLLEILNNVIIVVISYTTYDICGIKTRIAVLTPSHTIEIICFLNECFLLKALYIKKTDNVINDNGTKKDNMVKTEMLSQDIEYFTPSIVTVTFEV